MPRRKPSINERNIAAIERFSTAVRENTDDLYDATGDLLETLCNASQRQATQTAAFLLSQFEAQRKQITRLQEQLNLHQRHLEHVDLILDEQAQSRAAGG